MDNRPIWQRKTYLTSLPYIVSRHIYEYDIKKANINVLYAIGEIDLIFYNKLYQMNRMDRQVQIGYLLKNNKSLSDKLAEGIAYYRKRLFEENNLEEQDILSIKNDAVFVIGRKLSKTKFDNVEFVLKNSYTTYVKLNNIEVYFESNSVNSTISLDIKGISDINLELHHLYMATFIADCLYYIETGDINSGLTYISSFYNKYISRQLDYGYYRNFNADSDYTMIVNGSQYHIPYCNSQEMLMILDIGVNLNIIRELYGYMTEMYFQRNR